MKKAKPRKAPAKPRATPQSATAPIALQCATEIKRDTGMAYLPKGVAISYLLERLNYRQPEGATAAEAKRVLLSAARAEANLWFPAGLEKTETEKRVWLHRFIMAGENDENPAPPFKMTLAGWTNFFRSADQARQTYRGQIKFSPDTGTKFHPTIKSAFLPMESLAIVHHWISPDPEGASLAHCTAELACEIIAGISEAAHDPKNFGRKRRQLGLVSYSRAELRGHIVPA